MEAPSGRQQVLSERQWNKGVCEGEAFLLFCSTRRNGRRGLPRDADSVAQWNRRGPWGVRAKVDDEGLLTREMRGRS